MMYRDQYINLEEFRSYIVSKLSNILENHVRSYNLGEEIVNFFNKENSEFENKLTTIENILEKTPNGKELIQEARRCKNVRSTARDLIHERQAKGKKNQNDLKDLLVEVPSLINDLEKTIIDKDLLEKQSNIISNIILSHEKVSQWKEFIQEILVDFHSFFPFNVFYIAFAEEHNLLLNIFYMGEIIPKIKKQAKTRLVNSMLEKLNLPQESVLDLEEFIVNCKTCDKINENAVDLISVPVPEFLPKMEGILGVGYAYDKTLLPKEREIIISILSIMVMVVGSSKALAKTLSELEYHSVHDPLTNLHNRRYFKDILNYEISRSARHDSVFSILMIDIDNFKFINDSFGHPCGDNSLIQISEIMQKHTRKGDIITRYGGDEFAIILTETPTPGAVVVAETLRKEIKNTVFFNQSTNSEYHVTISIGVISYPKDANTIDDLLSGADLALYKSKDIGKDSVSIIDSVEQSLQTSRKILIDVERIRTAISEKKVLPYYHSIINCSTMEIHAYEMLARIRDNDNHIAAAANFIETAEKYGLIWDLDRLIITQGMTMRKNLEKNKTNLNTKLFINLSPHVIQGRGILNFAEEYCRKIKLSPENIVFEILERDAISEMTIMRIFLKLLREKGFQFALDDFGSGYNSFHYLRELKFDYVKIDGAFVKNILKSKIDYALVKNLSNLCKDIGIKTIAEFVETENIFTVVKEMGIDYAQGFYISQPVAEI